MINDYSELRENYLKWGKVWQVNTECFNDSARFQHSIKQKEHKIHQTLKVIPMAQNASDAQSIIYLELNKNYLQLDFNDKIL